MQKGGQVILFVIVGVLLLLGVFFIYHSSNPFPTKILLPSSIDASPIISAVESCLSKSLNEGIFTLGKKGGYLYDYGTVLNTEKWQVAFHEVYGKDSSPLIGFMESQLEQYIHRTIGFCLDFSDFKDFNISYGPSTVSVSILGSSVDSKLLMPVILKNLNEKKLVNTFSASSPVRLDSILKVKKDILYQDVLSLNRLTSYGLEVSVIPQGEGITVFSIEDNQSVYMGSNFIFNFAKTSDGNTPPRLDFLPDLVLKRNKPFSYKLIAFDNNDDNLIFSSDNPFVPVVWDKVSFTPSSLGKFSSTICVSDGIAKDCRQMTLVVNDD